MERHSSLEVYFLTDEASIYGANGQEFKIRMGAFRGDFRSGASSHVTADDEYDFSVKSPHPFAFSTGLSDSCLKIAPDTGHQLQMVPGTPI
jgi:hypothetical protein